MIDSVTITNISNAYGKNVTISMRYPEESGYYIKSIDGLGSPTADIITSDSPLKAGSYFNSARGTNRNIVLHLGFLWSSDYEIQTLREEMYNIASITNNVRITIDKSGSRYYCDGYVESNAPNIWDKNEGTDISIICPDPYWKSEVEYGAEFGMGFGAFEFPFSNESLTYKTIQFGNTAKLGYVEIENESSQPWGFTTRIHVEGYLDQIRLSNADYNEVMVIDYDFRHDDTIEIVSIQGHKSISLYRNGSLINILGAWNRASTWVQLYPGKNRMYLYPSKLTYWNHELDKQGKLLTGYTTGEIHFNTIYEGM